MARSFLRLLLQEQHSRTFFNLFAFSFPFLLISVFLTWVASSTSVPPAPSTPSAVAAADFLSPRGYSLFASALLSPSFNATGTVLAPPDFSLSFAGRTYLQAPPRASLSLLLYHTLNVPLTYHQLSSIADNSELHTLSGDNCLFLYKKYNGDISISVNKKRTLTVKIRQPDLYVDEHLTVHGIDGVLDPNSASTCSLVDRTVRIKHHVDRMFLDHAIRALKRRGFAVVGTAMAIKRRQLMALNGVTVFAVSDASFFGVSDGFRYDFDHHVINKRMRLSEISRVPFGTVMETMSQNKTIVFGEDDGKITVNGININVTEVYHNRWIVVVSILRSLDDAVESSDSLHHQVPSPAPSFNSESQSFSPAGAPSTSPDYSPGSVPSLSPVNSADFVPSPSPIQAPDFVPSPSPIEAPDFVPSPSLIEAPDSVPSPAPIYSGNAENITSPISGSVASDSARELSQSPSPIRSGEANVVAGPAPSNLPPVSSTDEAVLAAESPLPDYSTDEAAQPDEQCASELPDGGGEAVFVAIEGDDLFCPMNVRRKLDESKSGDVAPSQPSDLLSRGENKNESEPLITLVVASESKGDEERKEAKSKDQGFMADDLFFYN